MIYLRRLTGLARPAGQLIMPNNSRPRGFSMARERGTNDFKESRVVVKECASRILLGTEQMW